MRLAPEAAALLEAAPLRPERATQSTATGADLRDTRMLAELELAVLSRDFGVLVVPGE